LVKKLKLKFFASLSMALAAILIAILIVPMNDSSQVSGQITNFSELEAKIEEIVDGNPNVGVYIDTMDGTIGFNETKVVSSASTIKVPILVEALRQADQGELIWNDEVLVEDKDVVGGSGTIKNDPIPASYTVKELAELMMVVSDNTATNLIAERVGFDQVNWTCAKLGCVDTGAEKSDLYDAPIIKDFGIDMGNTPWTGLVAPPGTPEDRLQIIHDAFKQALEDPEVSEKLIEQGLPPYYADSEEFKKVIEERYQTNKKILEDIGMIE